MNYNFKYLQKIFSHKTRSISNLGRNGMARVLYNQFCSQSKNVTEQGLNIQKYETDGSASYTIKSDEQLLGNKEGGDLYALMFTCKPCGNKMTRTFTKNAYHTGVVIIRCSQCENNHLIADNLGWFDDDKWNVELKLGAKRISKAEVQEIIDQFEAPQNKNQKE